MLAGGISEAIMHFIGYLRTIDDIARERFDYDGSPLRYLPEDYLAKHPGAAAAMSPDDIEVIGTRAPNPLPYDDFEAKIHHMSSHQRAAIQHPDDDGLMGLSVGPDLRLAAAVVAASRRLR